MAQSVAAEEARLQSVRDEDAARHKDTEGEPREREPERERLGKPDLSDSHIDTHIPIEDPHVPRYAQATRGALPPLLMHPTLRCPCCDAPARNV